MALGRKIGLSYSINTRADKPSIFRVTFRGNVKPRRHPDRIKKRCVLAESRACHVYDLTTDSSHFAVGPGRLVVHNTDSVMVKMKGASCAQATAEGTRLANLMTRTIFPAPIELEYEKVWSAYLLYKKKSYCGLLDGNFTASGMELVRTDTAPVVTDAQRTCATHALHGRVQQAIQHLADVLKKVRAERNLEHDLDPFVRCAAITKAPGEYADPKPAHVAVAMRIVGAAKGDRIPYIVREGQEDRIADRCLHPLEWDAEKHAIDRAHYAYTIQHAVEPWLRAAAGADQDLHAALDAACNADRRTTFMPAHAPLAKLWGVQNAQRKRVAQPAQGAPDGKRQALMSVLFKPL
jgi:DNA polymerase elongation subunit (family B)